MARDYSADVKTILNAPWKDKVGKKVPTTDGVQLAGGATKIEATYLYADLARSTEIVRKLDNRIAAKLIKSYVQVAVNLIKANGGSVMSFDGDRVLGVFAEGAKNTNATRCALNIHYVLEQIIDPIFKDKYPGSLYEFFPLRHGIGIDSGKVWIVRAGARGDNDLVSIGNAANKAAKLSDIRNGPFGIYISENVRNYILDEVVFSYSGFDMWTKSQVLLAGELHTIYKSNFFQIPK